MRLLRLALFLAAGLDASLVRADDWKTLFKGDLSRWETWLGRPHESVVVEGLKRDSQTGKYLEPLGLNRDPKGVYGVVERDGGKVIRISGEIFGALTSKDEFESYHVTLEFAWGTQKWAPRAERPRDSGLLYRCVGPHGVAGGGAYWMRSQEFQIWEGEVGDYYSVGGAVADIAATQPVEKEPFVFTPGAPLVPFGVTMPDKRARNRCNRRTTNEKPHGQWNRLDLIVVGERSLHIVNGEVVMALQRSRQPADGKETPLLRGKLQLQSEGAEIFYRDIRIRKLKKLPTDYVKWFEPAPTK